MTIDEAVKINRPSNNEKLLPKWRVLELPKFFKACTTWAGGVGEVSRYHIYAG